MSHNLTVLIYERFIASKKAGGAWGQLKQSVISYVMVATDIRGAGDKQDGHFANKAVHDGKYSVMGGGRPKRHSCL